MTQPEVLRVGIRLAVAFEKPACRDDGASGRENATARGYRNDPPHAAARRSSCLYMTGSPGRDGGGGGGGGSGMYGVAGGYHAPERRQLPRQARDKVMAAI